MPVSVVRLPPMDLIRSFVTVGRRMSITLAADDLFLTQSAVSRQVRALEEVLGVKLFARGHRSLSFTPEGERLFRISDAAIRQLQEVVGAIGVARERRPVTVTASIGVSGLWLLPRLGRFQQRHPDIDLRISASNRIVDLRSEGVDLAIRYCPRSRAPERAARLFGESLAPVASPSLCRALDSRERLAQHVLLQFDDPRRYHLQWAEWLTSMGWTGVKPKGVLRFNQYDQVIHAAVAGQGIALGRLELLGPMLAEGRLAVLSTPRAPADDAYGYWLIEAEAEPREDVRDVAAWITAEAAGPDAASDGRRATAGAAGGRRSRQRASARCSSAWKIPGAAAITGPPATSPPGPG